MKSRILPMLQALVTIALLAWLFSDSRVRESAALWREAGPGWIALALLAGGVSDLAAAIRWWCCLHLARLPIDFSRAAALHFMGRFTTLFLPGSVGGDATKIALLAAEFPDRKLAGVIAALLDRLTGFVAVMAAAVIAAVWRREWFERSPQTAGLVYAVLIFFAITAAGLHLWYVVSRPRFRHRHPQWLPFREHHLELSTVFDRFLEGGVRALLTIVLSFVALGSFFLVFYCAARSLHVAVPLGDLFAIMPTIDIVTILPITLNGLGLREKTFETMLGALCGVAPGPAVLISLGGFILDSVWALPGAATLMLYRARRERVIAS
jgi:uncharacterized membrane protein YbhN (UPF0104 family)